LNKKNVQKDVATGDVLSGMQDTEPLAMFVMYVLMLVPFKMYVMVTVMTM